MVIRGGRGGERGGEEAQRGGEDGGRGKEPVCVLRLPCDSGSCLLAGASIPTQLDWGATLPGAAKRENETTKKHKMNRQSNQPKTRGSSTPARRHLLLPSLEAL
ncbi:hypothetical protein ABFV05_005376 [Capra hircus]